MNRRDMVFAGLGLAGLGLAEGLRPRRRMILLQGATIEKAMPMDFTGWSSETASNLVGPEMAGKLAKSLYSEMVARTYYSEADGAEVMVLAAYGDTQSDLLQVHRPETCYPAVGFNLELSEPLALPVAAGVTLPVRKVVAAAEGRTENIIYWTRIGEALPQSGEAQRNARLRNSMQGFVADGILFRCSVLGDPKDAFPVLERFVPALLRAIPTPVRKAFIGTDLATRIA